MNKKQLNKDNTFDEPTDEIQSKITELMGLPADQAEPTLSKNQEPNIQKNHSVSADQINAQNSNIGQPEDTIVDEKDNFESPATDEAVVEIVKDESDELLKKQDENVAEFKIEPKQKNSLFSFYKKLWRNKKLRYATLLLTIVGLTLAFGLPSSRYATLNAIGVRSSTSFIVIDKVSGRPVKNVDVVLADQTTKTNQEGSITLNNLKLGKANLTLSKRSFEPINTTVIIGWGSNPFESPFEVLPTGTTFNFSIKDWIDGQPIKDSEITDGESIGIANENGEANIKIEPTDEDLTITISAQGYRSESVTIPADSTAPQQIELVASKPDVFISKRSGNYDLYKRDIDGKNEELILPATGNEQADIYAVGHPTDYNLAALVSSREGKRNSDGYMLSDLYIVDLSKKTADKVDSTQSERIRIIGWNDEKIIYVKTIAGPSASLGNRQRIIVYDYKKKDQIELASANYFTDARLINNQLYYVVSSGIQGSQGPGLAKIDLDGNNRRVLIGDNIWAIYRTADNNIVVNADNEKWYSISIEDSTILELTGPPAQPQDIKYFISPNKDLLARVEKRDGKTELLVTNKDSKDTLVLRQSGISLPIEWVNNKTIIYGIVTNEETSRYVVSLLNNKAVKIGDNTASIYDGVLYY